MKQTIHTVAYEVSQVLANVDEQQAKQLSESIKKAKRIFVSGEGRSGLIGKVFAMRLMHGGYNVYVTGETITPSIESGDLLIVISGSGSANSLHQYTTKAKETGAQVALVTTNPHSKVAVISDVVLVVPAATKKRLPAEPTTIQPLGNQFDQSVHLLLDAMIIYTLEGDERLSHEQMANRHANLE